MFFVTADITKESDINRLASEAESFGGVDILVGSFLKSNKSLYQCFMSSELPTDSYSE